MAITLPPVKKYTAAQLQDSKLPAIASPLVPVIGIGGSFIVPAPV